ncbi:MAG: phage holin family protein [Pyrinomonadaceae bacterium]
MAAPSKALSGETVTAQPRLPEGESLPSLFSRLGDDVMQLFDTKMSLLKVEIKEEANAFAKASMVIALGAIVAAIGFALVNVAVALGVSTLFANLDLSQPARYALGFVLTGFFYLVVGGLVISVMKNRLAKVEVVPNRTVEELRKDRQWLKNEI